MTVAPLGTAEGGPTEDGSRGAAGVTTAEREEWDDALRRGGGHLLQSWRWGTFKERYGWRAERVRVDGPRGSAMAQVLFKHRGPVSLAYVPRGPLILGDEETARHLFTALDDVCRRHRALSLIVECDRPLPLAGGYRKAGFIRGPEHIQPSRTVKVPLLDDEALLNQMHQKTRYNVRLAQRRGVVLRRAAANADTLETFYDLLRDTADRNAFGIHERGYYDDFMRIFGDAAVLLFAIVEEVPAAGLIAARFGEEAIYMYGASSTRYRAHGAGFYLQYEAMRWARENGCSRYDLWGIPAHDPPSTEVDEGDRVAGTRGDDWRGLYEFKVRFGGEIVRYPPTLERRYHPLLAVLARRAYRGRTVDAG